MNGRAPLLERTDDGVGERVVWRFWVGRLGAPAYAAPRHLEARAVDVASVDRITRIEVGVAVAVRAHVARGGKTGPQIRLEVLDRDDRRALARHLRRRIVEHVRVRVDEAGQHGRATEIDRLCTRRDRHFSLVANFGDALTLYEDDLLGEHRAGQAVEHAASANRRDAGRCWITRYRSALRDDARRRSDVAPGRWHRWSSRRRRSLRLRRLRDERRA